jgi:redox-sensitive bicupin YhaK (pirin superfamily)
MKAASRETPMIEIKPYTALSGDDRDWLKARCHIPVAVSLRTVTGNWGALRAWNDDEIAPQSGFPPHSHASMEIITYVREGVITHRDSLGNVGYTCAGDVQVMSTGTGIRHCEYNLENTAARLFQIWIAPDRFGGAPAWGTKHFPREDRAGRLVTLASGYDEDTEALPIRARARVLGATLRKGVSLNHIFAEHRFGYLVAARGQMALNDLLMEERDGAAIRNVSSISLKALRDAEVILVDVPV